MHLPVGFLARFGQGVETQRSTLIALENGFAPVATIDDVIDRSRILDAEFSGHAHEFAPEKENRQRIMRLCGTDPFA